MRKVIGIGETVLDIIFKNEQPIGAVPGGSVFNGIISLGRAGINTTFISETGNDRVGRNIIQFLKDNQVDVTNINVYPEAKSPVSLAFLNEQNDAEYIFYKDHPHDKLDFVYPDIQPNDIVIYGSYYAVNPVIRPQMQSFLEYAHNQGAILYYDVNFRSSHRNEVVKLRANILENLEYADIVRGSDEDFDVMFNMTGADMVYRSQISFYCKNFIYTQGSKPVEVRGSNGMSKAFEVKRADTLSTIGAGDNFNAGFIYGMMKEGITLNMLEEGLSETQWDLIIDQGQQFSENVCKSINNSIDQEFAAIKKREMEGI